MKIVRIILSEEAVAAYCKLKNSSHRSKKDRSIFNGIEKKVQLIRSNPHYGEPISKKSIPGKYKDLYGISNLFWVKLPDYWRMLYTLTRSNDAREIIVFLVDIIDHRKYDKIFGYKKK